jgi:hypothetical protein
LTTDFEFFTITTFPGNNPGMEVEFLGFLPASLIFVPGLVFVCRVWNEIAVAGIAAMAAPPAPTNVKNLLRFIDLPFMIRLLFLKNLIKDSN